MGKDLSLFGYHVIRKWTNQRQHDLTNHGHFDLIWSSSDPKMDQ